MSTAHAAPASLYPWLTQLPAALQERLLHPGARIALPAGTRIFSENQPCQGFPLVLEGCIKVIKNTASGREMLLYRVEPGGSCIITSSCLLGQSDYNACGITETPVILQALPVDLFEQLLAGQPAFRAFVFHLFAERIAELMQLVEEVAFSRLDQRLAKLLLARGESVLNVTHQQLAEELGSVREIISRLLKNFAARELVGLGREQITLLDREGLRQLADPAN